MIKLLSEKSFLGSVLLFVLISSLCFEAKGYQPKQKNITTLTEWTNSCFKKLKEYQTRIDPEQQGADIPRTFLEFRELKRLTRTFIRSMKKSSFTNESTWLSRNYPKSELFNWDVKLDYNQPVLPYVQKLVVRPGSKVCFIGDLHGSVHSLLRNLWRLVALGYLDESFAIKKSNFYMIFNGDFVDRGRYGVEVLYTLMRLKLANWDNIFLLRGNHEDKDLNDRDGFLNELEAKYDVVDIEQDLKNEVFMHFGQESKVSKDVINFDQDKKAYNNIANEFSIIKKDVKGLKKQLGSDHEQVKDLGKKIRIQQTKNTKFLRDLKAKEELPTIKQFNALLSKKYENPYDFIWRFFEMLPFALFLGSGEGENLSFVQCCHGGIEPGYDPKQLLASDKLFDAISSVISQDTTEESPYYEDEKPNNHAGFRWSDFAQSYTNNKEIKERVYQDVVDHIKGKGLSIQQINLNSYMTRGFEMLKGSIVWNESRGAGYIADIVSTFDYLQKNNLRAFFRGHQDQLFGLKMFFNNDFVYQAAWNTNLSFQQERNYPCGPYNWRRVTSAEDQSSLDGFLIAKYVPVFTFTSATEGQVVPFDCFGILTTGQRYEEWLLKPYEINLEPVAHKEQRHEKYVALDVAQPGSGDQISINFVNDPELAGVAQGLAELAVVFKDIQIE